MRESEGERAWSEEEDGERERGNKGQREQWEERRCRRRGEDGNGRRRVLCTIEIIFRCTREKEGERERNMSTNHGPSHSPTLLKIIKKIKTNAYFFVTLKLHFSI